MRARRIHGLVAASVLVLLISTGLSAHRRDEYLQAARIALEPDAVVLQLDVTPGIDVAVDFVRSLDRDGDGALSRLRAHAAIAEVSTGVHRVFFGNGHLADQSAYLANALVPDDSNVSVAAQRRTVAQRELTIEYAVGPGAETGRATWFLVSLAMAAIVMVRARG